MATKITREIIESYLNCQYKAHLKLSRQHGTKSEYELLLAELRGEVRCQTIEQISTHQQDTVRNRLLSLATLRRGASFFLDATLEDDQASLVFDGLKRVDGPSRLGEFHYIPVLFSEGRRIRKTQRLLLDVYAFSLARLQGRMPSSGIVWHGKECRSTRVRLSPDLRKTERLLEDIRHLENPESPPKLVLNDHCHVCEFRQRCYDQAMQEDNLSLLRGMKEKEVKGYARKGILTVTQLAHTFRPKRSGKRSPPRNNHRYHALQALAIRDRRVYLLGTPQLPDTPVRIYLDIEGNPEEGFDYLIGMIVCNGDTEQRFSFWADNPDQEEQIFEQFLATVNRYPDFHIFSYGSYGRVFLRRMRKHAKRKAPVDRILKALVNILSLIYPHVYFPTYSNGLKEVGACLGCSWTEPDASGIQSLVWRRRWEVTHAEEWKQKLTAYNLEDCAALRKVTEFLYAVSSGSENHPQPVGTRTPAVASVEEIDKLGTVNTRGQKQFFHPDFKYINDCAHFNYQRQRVYVRTKRVSKKHRRKPKRLLNRKVRVNQRIVLNDRKCPSCGGTEVKQWEKGKKISGYSTRHKQAFDLVFTSSGIKRKVIECTSSVHQCRKCGEIFVPERYQRLAKHFHGLVSWAIYNHVAHRVSCSTLSVMIEDYFDLAVCQQELHRFKERMARYYRPCFKGLLDKICSSTVLHVDETEVKLRSGKGYVWVFTTGEEVMYLYRPTREGGFLLDLLKNFTGVLVTDFYAAYDSLGCPQQKCLIHLMRDMNQELLNNPYDQELQLITGPFGTLLREIVETIDQHGLKRRYLEKHTKAVAKYFESLATQTFRSEAAEALRERLVKYREKLFTFIQHDGVPWNNNNAENAIRQFAYYREDTTRTLTEVGLTDHLVLLSICQTCRYKNVSFLKFLLSKEQDIDAFCEGQRRKRRSSTIEVYPKGVLRPDFRRPTKTAAEQKPLDKQ
jgi:predicted RecB family nuclease